MIINTRTVILTPEDLASLDALDHALNHVRTPYVNKGLVFILGAAAMRRIKELTIQDTRVLLEQSRMTRPIGPTGFAAPTSPTFGQVDASDLVYTYRAIPLVEATFSSHRAEDGTDNAGLWAVLIAFSQE